MILSFWDFITGRAGRDDRDLRERGAKLDGAMAAIHDVIETIKDMPGQEPQDPLPLLLPRDPLDFHGLPIVWRVHLPQREAVYMGIGRAPAGEEYDRKRYVVIVRSILFYAAWRAADLALHADRTRALLPSEIPTDYKWSGQGPNWTGGRRNPVYLPDVGYHPSRGPAFVDGVTRSLWLVYNGATSFPVAVSGKESAQGLYALAGDPRTKPESIHALSS